jgi:hypothetical protein
LVEKKELSERTKTNKPNTQDKEEADRRQRARNALIANTLLVVLDQIIFFIGRQLPPWDPMAFLLLSVYFTLLIAATVLVLRVAHSPVAVKLVAAGLILIAIFAITVAVVGTLPVQEQAPAYLIIFITLLAGGALFGTGALIAWWRVWRKVRTP